MVRVGVLGPLEVIADDGTSVLVSGLKQRALLAMLAVDWVALSHRIGWSTR